MFILMLVLMSNILINVNIRILKIRKKMINQLIGSSTSSSSVQRKCQGRPPGRRTEVSSHPPKWNDVERCRTMWKGTLSKNAAHQIHSCLC